MPIVCRCQADDVYTTQTKDGLNEFPMDYKLDYY